MASHARNVLGILLCLGLTLEMHGACPPVFASTNSNPSNAFATVVGDFNGDGKLDIARAVDRPRYIHVFLGIGDGTFQPPVRHVLFGGLSGVGADFNGDGRTDLVTLSDVSSLVYVYLARTDGLFDDRVEIAVASQPAIAAAEDVNGDARPDLIVGYWFRPDITVLLGGGDGTFGPPTTYATGLHAPAAVKVADLDRDGLMDIAAISDSGGVSLLLGRPGGVFAAGPHRGLGAAAQGVALSDVNNDGIADLVLASGQRVAVALGLGTGRFARTLVYVIGGSANHVVLADLNGDRRLDMVVLHAQHTFASILVGNGDGTFTPVPPITVGYQQGIGVGDFNADGRNDLAFASRVLLNTTCRADFNCSGAATVQDLSDFLSAWLARESSADFDYSGIVNPADLFGFLRSWFARCT